MKLKLFEGGTLKEELQRCLKEGYFPATIEQIKQFKKEGKIDKEKTYDTSTISFPPFVEKRTATKKELENIEETYKNGGLIWFVDYRYNDSYALSYYALNYDNSSLVGVAVEPHKKHKYVCECGKVRKC